MPPWCDVWREDTEEWNKKKMETPSNGLACFRIRSLKIKTIKTSGSCLLRRTNVQSLCSLSTSLWVLFESGLKPPVSSQRCRRLRASPGSATISGGFQVLVHPVAHCRLIADISLKTLSSLTHPRRFAPPQFTFPYLFHHWQNSEFEPPLRRHSEMHNLDYWPETAIIRRQNSRPLGPRNKRRINGHWASATIFRVKELNMDTIDWKYYRFGFWRGPSGHDYRRWLTVVFTF